MAKKRKLAVNKIDNSLFLLASIAGGTLFSFGLLEVIKDRWDPLYAVYLGAFLIIGLIVIRKYTTETAFAMKKR